MERKLEHLEQVDFAYKRATSRFYKNAIKCGLLRGIVRAKEATRRGVA